MFVTDYTTLDEIRAALGVSEDEIEDATLSLPMYDNILQIELEDIHVGIPAAYEAVKALGISITAEQGRFAQAAHLFATYAIARQLTTSLPLFSPEQITDGKAAVRRNQDAPYQKVTDAVAREYSRFRNRLDQMFSVINSSTSAGVTPKRYFGVIAPASDPITGT